MGDKECLTSRTETDLIDIEKKCRGNSGYSVEHLKQSTAHELGPCVLSSPEGEALAEKAAAIVKKKVNNLCNQKKKNQLKRAFAEHRSYRE